MVPLRNGPMTMVQTTFLWNQEFIESKVGLSTRRREQGLPRTERRCASSWLLGLALGPPTPSDMVPDIGAYGYLVGVYACGSESAAGT